MESNLRPMNILIYIPNISKKQGGIYQYTIALLNVLSKNASHDYYIFSGLKNKEIRALVNQVDNFHTIPSKACFDSRVKERLYGLFRRISSFNKLFKINFHELMAVNRCIRKYNIDLTHCPYDYIPIEVSSPWISTIHDLQELLFPEYFTPHQRIDRAIARERIVNNSAHLICSYEHIKKDIAFYFPSVAGMISPILLSMESLWINQLDSSNLSYPDFLSEGTPFLLYPAATWKHKNHERLLRAFVKVRDISPHIFLVCTGHKTEHWNFISELIDELDLRESVIFPGVVDDAVLFSLYHRCTAVVIPTLYEAGSFPLMESLLCGIPVICSRVTSLPETIGNEDFTFDAENESDIARAIIQICENKELREESSLNSGKQRKKIIDNGSIDKILDVYELIGKKGNVRS